MSKSHRISCRALAACLCSFLTCAVLLADALTMLLAPGICAGPLEHIGYPAQHLPYLAGILVLGMCAYLTHRLAWIGCGVLTAFLGGAVATHARIGEAMSVPVLTCVMLGVLLWTGWLMREAE